MKNITHLVNFAKLVCKIVKYSTEALAIVTKYVKFNFCEQLKNPDTSKCRKGYF
jgi:hypothetical protein